MILNQLQSLEACVSVTADNDVIVHCYVQRLQHVNDRACHGNIGAGRRRVGQGMIMHQYDCGRG